MCEAADQGKPARGSQAASFAAAFSGIAAAFAGEPHMKVHAAFAVAALVACAVLRVAAWGWCVVIVCIALVIAAELLNTALEALCDKVSPELDPHIKLAKDCAAGAVLVCALASVAAGLVVYVSALAALL